MCEGGVDLTSRRWVVAFLPRSIGGATTLVPLSFHSAFSVSATFCIPAGCGAVADDSISVKPCALRLRAAASSNRSYAGDGREIGRERRDPDPIGTYESWRHERVLQRRAQLARWSRERCACRAPGGPTV